MFIINKLPTDIFYLLFGKWISLRDVCLFDLALTQHKYRKEFLKKLTEIVFENRYYYGYHKKLSYKSNMLRWLSSRSLSLRDLGIDGYNITMDESILVINKCVKLNYLEIQNMNLSLTFICEILNTCLELNTIYIKNCKFIDDHENNFLILSKIKKLKIIDSSGLNDILICKISKMCMELEELDIQICDITDIGIIEFSKCRKLNKLCINGCYYLTINVFSSLSNFSILNKLVIKNNYEEITKTNFTINFCNIQVLDLSQFEVNDNNFLIIAKNCIYVKELHCPKSISKENIILITKNLVRLEKINFDNCKFIDDDGLICLIKAYPNITSLSLAGCKKITNRGIINISNCLMLKELNLLNCNFYSSIIEIAKKCVFLTIIRINIIGEKAIVLLARNCKNLKILHTSSEFNNNIFKVLGKNCLQLEFLSCKCNHVTDYGIKQLLNGCKTIKEMQLFNCFKITNNSIDVILKIRLISLILTNCKYITREPFQYMLNISSKFLCLSKESFWINLNF